MVGIWHEINVLSSKINMLSQNKYFFMSFRNKNDVPKKWFSGSCAKLSQRVIFLRIFLPAPLNSKGLFNRGQKFLKKL